MSGVVTQAEFGEEIARIGALATGWVHQAFGPREEWAMPVDEEQAAEFLRAMRARLDAIEARARPASSGAPEI